MKINPESNKNSIIHMKWAMLATSIYFVTLIAYTFCIVEPRIISETGIITSFKSYINLRIKYNDFTLADKPYVLRTPTSVIGAYTASSELNRLGISSGDDKNLQIEVSYSIDATNKRRETPIGLRKGKDMYIKDFWYYITLFSYTSKKGLFILFSLAVIVLGLFSKYPDKKNVAIAFHIFIFLFLIFYAFI